MAKGAGSEISTAGNITGQQLGAAQTAGQESQASLQQMQNLIAPYISQQQTLATGNRSAATAAAMPTISQLSSGYEGAKAQIMNNVPAGAARDQALAQLASQKSTTIGGAEASAVQGAPAALASMGTTIGGMGLQELGAQLAGLQGGAQTNLGAGQMAAAQQQAMLNFFGQLAGAAGRMVAPIKL